MTFEEINELSNIIGKLEALSTTYEVIRMYVEPARGSVADVFYTANTAMEHVVKEIDAKVHEIYKNHNQED